MDRLWRHHLQSLNSANTQTIADQLADLFSDHSLFGEQNYPGYSHKNCANIGFLITDVEFGVSKYNFFLQIKIEN